VCACLLFIYDQVPAVSTNRHFVIDCKTFHFVTFNICIISKTNAC